MADGASDVSNLERSAFWIYGVTAMIMREPLGTLLRNGAAAGWADPEVVIEVFRTLLVLAFLSRLFLAAGLHFEIVYMRPEAAVRFPRRSYPVDFLAGLVQLLIGVAASTTVSLHGPGQFQLFGLLAAAVLLSDVLWLAVTALLRFSAVRKVAARAATGTAILALGLACLLATHSEAAALAVLLLLTSVDAALLIRHYSEVARAEV